MLQYSNVLQSVFEFRSSRVCLCAFLSGLGAVEGDSPAAVAGQREGEEGCASLSAPVPQEIPPGLGPLSTAPYSQEAAVQ